MITKHGKPVAKLVALDAEEGSPFGLLRGTLLEQGDIAAPDFEAWEEKPRVTVRPALAHG